MGKDIAILIAAEGGTWAEDKARMRLHWGHRALLPMHRADPVYIYQGMVRDLRNYRLTINTMAEPDACAETLTSAVAVCKGLNLINRPERILLHRRDTAARMLQGIEGLIVPNTLRLVAESRRGVGDLPRILRRCGTNDGKTMTLVRTPDEATAFLAANRGAETYSTTFIDSPGADGLHRKFRIRMVDGAPFPIHLYCGRGWCVHSADAKAAFAENPALQDQEAEFLSTPLPFKLRQVLAEIHERIGVEVYGIDLGMCEDGRYVFYEANASMTFLTRWQLERPAARSAAERMLDAHRQLIERRAS